MKIIELRQKRAVLFEQARAILDKAEAEKRELTAEERQQYDRIMADVDALKGDIDRLERAEEVAKEMAAKNETRDIEPKREQRDVPIIATPEYRDAFIGWLRGGMEALASEQRQTLARGRVTPEGRALSAITGTAGGYTVPQGFRAQIVDAMKAFSGMHQARVTVLNTTSGNDLAIPTANDTANVGELVAENTAATAQDLAFGQVILKAYKYSSKTVLVPFELLQDTAVDLEAFIARKLGERIGRITNQHFTTGDGTNKPRGVITDAENGKVGATGQTTSVTYEDLVDLIHAVDPAYRQNAQFMLHDTTLKALKKLKDSTGRPLWLPGLAEREPDTILGYPYVINVDVPQMAASAKSILFGDFANYYIRDVMDVTLFRITDKYIESGQVGFLAWFRTDGRLVDAGMHPIAYYQNSAT